MNLREDSTTQVCATAAAVPKTLLFEMAEKGDHVALLRLVDGIDMDFHETPQRNERGDTALHVAARGGHLRAVVVLVGLGWDINCPGNRLRTPLHCAVAQGHLKVARRLLIAGAKVDAKDANNATPLALAAGQGNRECVKILLQHGARPDETALFTAAENNHWDLVELFLTFKTLPVDMCNKDGVPLIVVAAKAKHWGMVDLLLEKGACPTKSKVAHGCALVFASEAGEAHTVRQLLCHGAALDEQQVSIAILVTRSVDVVWTFADFDKLRGAPGSLALAQAVCDGRLETLVALLDAGVNVNTRNRHNASILSYAVTRGQLECVKTLLQRGADVNSKDRFGVTPLHEAALIGDLECVRALLDAGASTTEVTAEGWTPLDVTSSSEVRKLLSGRN